MTIPLPEIFLGRVKISLLTVAALAALIAFDTSVYTLLTLTAAALHEAGHIFAAFFLHAGIEQITVYPFGADIRLDSRIRSHRTDFIISGAGAVANLAVGLPLVLAKTGGICGMYFGVCNLSLAAMNLLPESHLDGGGMLRAVLFSVCGEEKAARICRFVSFASLIILWLAGSYILFYSASNPSLFLICIYLFASEFIPRRIIKDFRG